jgi:chromosome segregation ATPase
MFGGVNVTAADVGGVYALLAVLSDPKKAKAALDELNEKVEANEKVLAEIRKERERATEVLAAAEKSEKAAAKLEHEVEKMRVDVTAEGATVRADITRQQVALVARETALQRRIDEVKAREEAVIRREALTAEILAEKAAAGKALAEAERMKAEAAGRLERIKAAAA